MAQKILDTGMPLRRVFYFGLLLLKPLHNAGRLLRHPLRKRQSGNLFSEAIPHFGGVWGEGPSYFQSMTLYIDCICLDFECYWIWCLDLGHTPQTKPRFDRPEEGKIRSTRSS